MTALRIAIWLPGNDGEMGSHHEQAHDIEPRVHGPFTSIDQIGALKLSDAGVPSELTGPWALAAAMHVGFADAPPLPFAQDDWSTTLR